MSPMFTSETKLRVRYGETDQMGVVYHGNYPLYFEVARVEALRDVGLSYKQMEESGVLMPVVEVNMKFLNSARYDDLITIKTTLPEFPGVRIFFRYELFNEAGQKLCEASTLLVFIKSDTKRPVRCPDILLQRLKPYFEK